MGFLYKKIIAGILLVAFIAGPVSLQVASAQGTSQPSSPKYVTQPQNPAPDQYNLRCLYWFGLDFGGCVAIAGEYIFFWPTYWLLRGAAAVFDASLAFTMSTSVIDQPFVRSTWGTIRDLTNLIFIFILLYIAIATILRLSDYKKLISSLIIVALLLNFSFFITRVVIDSANIIAMQFYNAIAAPVAPSPHIAGTAQVPVVQEKEISAMIVNAFDPQSIAGSASFQKWKANGGGSAGLFFVFLFAGIVVAFTAYVFLKIAFVLIARLVALWFLIIASPFAFAAFILPQTARMGRMWWEKLISQAFLVPVFLVMMYIIGQLATSALLTSIFPSGAANSIIDIMISSALAFIVIFIALQTALKVTLKMSESSGAWAASIGGKAVGFVGGAVGGAALRRGVGSTSRRIADSNFIKRTAARSGFTGAVGRTAERFANYGAGATYDFRNISAVSNKEFGKGGGKGGYDKIVSKKAKSTAAQIKRISQDRFGNELLVDTGRTRTVYDEVDTPIINPATNTPFKKAVSREEPEIISVKDAYIENLKRERNEAFKADWGRKGYTRARADLEAVKIATKKPSEKDEIIAAIKEEMDKGKEE